MVYDVFEAAAGLQHVHIERAFIQNQQSLMNLYLIRALYGFVFGHSTHFKRMRYKGVKRVDYQVVWRGERDAVSQGMGIRYMYGRARGVSPWAAQPADWRQAPSTELVRGEWAHAVGGLGWAVQQLRPRSEHNQPLVRGHSVDAQLALGQTGLVQLRTSPASEHCLPRLPTRS